MNYRPCVDRRVAISGQIPGEQTGHYRPQSTDISCLSSRYRAASWRSARGKGMHSTEHHRKLNSPEAAEYLGISVSTLSKRRVDGDGPKYLKLGRRVVYDTRDLDAWLDTRRRASTADGPRLMGAAHAHARPGRRPQLRNGNSGTVKLAESRLGRSRVGQVNGRDEDPSRPDLRRPSLPC